MCRMPAREGSELGRMIGVVGTEVCTGEPKVHHAVLFITFLQPAAENRGDHVVGRR